MDSRARRRRAAQAATFPRLLRRTHSIYKSTFYTEENILYRRSHSIQCVFPGWHIEECSWVWHTLLYPQHVRTRNMCTYMCVTGPGSTAGHRKGQGARLDVELSPRKAVGLPCVLRPPEVRGMNSQK